jgi:hypothetical protein
MPIKSMPSLRNRRASLLPICPAAPVMRIIKPPVSIILMDLLIIVYYKISYISLSIFEFVDDILPKAINIAL